jgi:hypothetical protein
MWEVLAACLVTAFLFYTFCGGSCYNSGGQLSILSSGTQRMVREDDKGFVLTQNGTTITWDYRSDQPTITGRNPSSITWTKRGDIAYIKASTGLSSQVFEFRYRY